MIFSIFRTCCFNYLRKRSSPPIQQSQTLSTEYDDNAIWLNKPELEKIIRNEYLRQYNPNRMELNQKGAKKDDQQKSTLTSNSNQILTNNHDQIRVIYDI